MDIQQIQAFVNVAENRSITKAAEKLYVSVSTITMQIKSLENEVGYKLFERLYHEMKMTSTGLLFYQSAVKVLQLTGELNSGLEALRGVAKGRLDIAASEPTATYYLPFILKKFGEMYPNVILNVYTSSYPEALRRIRDGTAELGLLKESPRSVKEHNIFLFSDHIIPVFNSNHPLAGKASITPEDINQYRILCFAPYSQEWEKINQWFMNDQSLPNVFMAINHIETIKELLMKTEFISFLPSFAIHDELKQKILSTSALYPSLTVLRKTFLTIRQEKLLSPTAKAFVQFISQDSILNKLKGT